MPIELSVRPAPLILIANIAHRHGTNSYAAADRPALYAQLADYCVEWWDERADRDIAKPDGLDDEAIVAAYFSGHETESYETSETALASTPHYNSPFGAIVEAGQVLHDLVEEAIDTHIYSEDDEVDEEECGYHIGAREWKKLMPKSEAAAEA